MTTNNITDNEVIDTTAPEKIWIVIGEEGNYQDSTCGFEEICWCEDKQGDNDVKYIRADLAKQESEKEIAELKSQLSILKPHPKCDTSCLLACKMEADAFEHEYNRATELQSQVNMLLEALGKLKNEVKHELNVSFIADIDKTLSATAKQSLIEHDNEVLDKLRVRNWTEQMSHAWHRAIPDIEKAFDDLIEALKEVKRC